MKKFIDLTNHSFEFSKTANNWVKDLTFCKNESKFLDNLFEGYDLQYSSTCYSVQLKTMKSQLAVLVKTIDQISIVLQEQLESLKSTMNGLMAQNDEVINDKQSKIKLSIDLLNQNMRKLKNDLFTFAESAERSEEGFLN
jgi:hypothetical protein